MYCLPLKDTIKGCYYLKRQYRTQMTEIYSSSSKINQKTKK